MPLVLLVTLAVLAAPSLASARTDFKGRLSRGGKVDVRVKRNGIVKRVHFHWHHSCDAGPSPFRGNVYYRRPFRAAQSKTFVSDRGSFISYRRGDYVIRVFTGMRARKVSARRWKGTFRARARIKDDGHRVAACRLGKVTWRAQRG